MKHQHLIWGIKCLTLFSCEFLREDMTLLNIPLFSTMCFQTSPQIACLIALFTLAALLTFPHCAFSNESSNGLPERMDSHICYICSAFLHCVFSDVSSSCLPVRMHSHIGCICLPFLHCVFSDVSSNGLPERIHSHIGCIYLTFL